MAATRRRGPCSSSPGSLPSQPRRPPPPSRDPAIRVITGAANRDEIHPDLPQHWRRLRRAKVATDRPIRHSRLGSRVWAMRCPMSSPSWSTRRARLGHAPVRRDERANQARTHGLEDPPHRRVVRDLPAGPCVAPLARAVTVSGWAAPAGRQVLKRALDRHDRAPDRGGSSTRTGSSARQNGRSCAPSTASQPTNSHWRADRRIARALSVPAGCWR